MCTAQGRLIPALLRFHWQDELGNLSLHLAQVRRDVEATFPDAGHAGLIVIDWEREDPTVSLQARDMDDNIRLRLDMNLSSLQPNKDLDR